MALQSKADKFRKENIRPIDWKLYPIISVADEKTECYLTRLTAFDFEKGTIIPEIYEEHIFSKELGRKIFYWQIAKAKAMYDQYKSMNNEMPVLIITAPDEIFLEEGYNKEFIEFTKKLGFGLATKLCIMFNEGIIYKENERVITAINDLREKGSMTALKLSRESEFAPLKLKSKKFDYILFTTDFSISVADGNDEEQSLLELISKSGYKCVLSNRYNEAYNELDKNNLENEYYMVTGTGLTIRELTEKELIGELLKGISNGVIERYGLEGKSNYEIAEIINKIDTGDKKREEDDDLQWEVTVLDKSFEAKLIKSDEKVKDYYNRIKNFLLSFDKVHSRLSWKHESFTYGRNTVAIITIRGKTLTVNLNISDDTINLYKVEESTGRAYEKVPYRYKVTGDRRFINLLRLLDSELTDLGSEKGETLDINYCGETESISSLIRQGKIKKKKRKSHI